MIRLLAIIAACLLSACATYAEVQALSPRLEVVSAKPPADFSGCIMPKARELWGSYVSIGPDGAAQVMTVSVEGARMHATLTITPEGPGSRVIYRSTTSLGKHKKFQSAIAACV